MSCGIFPDFIVIKSLFLAQLLRQLEQPPQQQQLPLSILIPLVIGETRDFSGLQTDINFFSFTFHFDLRGVLQSRDRDSEKERERVSEKAPTEGAKVHYAHAAAAEVVCVS